MALSLGVSKKKPEWVSCSGGVVWEKVDGKRVRYLNVSLCNAGPLH